MSPKHVYYNENMDYFHYPYLGANKELRGFARTATICKRHIAHIEHNSTPCQCQLHVIMFWRTRAQLLAIVGGGVIAGGVTGFRTLDDAPAGDSGLPAHFVLFLLTFSQKHHSVPWGVLPIKLR